MKISELLNEGHRDYDDNRTGFGDQGKRDFKRREMEHELGHETNNYAVAIDGNRPARSNVTSKRIYGRLMVDYKVLYYD